MEVKNLYGALGKKISYPERYDSDILLPISRSIARNDLGLHNTKLPFFGGDVWNCYEISWLDHSGKPHVNIGRFFVDCDSEFIIESKSLKLYLNSLNNHVFQDAKEVESLISQDISTHLCSSIKFELFELDNFTPGTLQEFQALCIDQTPLTSPLETQKPTANILQIHDRRVEEELYSNLLKSNCLVTGQPDWASVYIKYIGNAINHESLLRYIISFRNHNEFHEQCVERIFCDLLTTCQPLELTVYAKYTRRGGIDINPYRSTQAIEYNELDKSRHIRQ